MRTVMRTLACCELFHLLVKKYSIHISFVSEDNGLTFCQSMAPTKRTGCRLHVAFCIQT